MKTQAITCSAIELAFLAGLLGADSLTGVPDPFAGWSTEAVNRACDEARQALADRRLVAIGPDGSISIEESVAELVGMCGFAEATFMLTYTGADGTAAGHHFHVIRQSAVELVLSHDTVLSCQLRPLDTEAVLQRVADIFRLGEQCGPDVPNARLTERSLRAARKVAEESGAEAAEQFLLGAGLSPEVSGALADTLARPLGNGALVAMRNDQSEHGVDGLALLEGESGLWLLRIQHEAGTGWVDLVPCTAPTMLEFIRTVMNRVLLGKLV